MSSESDTENDDYGLLGELLDEERREIFQQETDIFQSNFDTNEGPAIYRSVDIHEHHADASDSLRFLDIPHEAFLPSKKEILEPMSRLCQDMPINSTHFYLKGQLETVVGAVTVTLQDHQVDLVFDADKHKWECCWCSATRPIKFLVYLNACKTPTGENIYLFELFRHTGNSCEFMDLFQKVVDTVGYLRVCSAGKECPIEETNKMDFVDAWKPSLSRSTSNASTVPDFDFDFEFEVSDEELFKPFVNLCSSNFAETRLEGFDSVLYECKKNYTTRLFTAFPSLMDMVCKELNSPFEFESELSCVRILSHVASEKNLHDMVPVELLASISCREFNPLHMEVQREAVRTLANMCKSGSVSYVAKAIEPKMSRFKHLYDQKDVAFNKAVDMVNLFLARV